MTNNQIQYWRNVESERSNRANELETRRSNLAREAETRRANLSRERQLRQDYELNRDLKSTELRERERSNRNSERINEAHYKRQDSAQQFGAATARSVANETHRSNLARENFNLLDLAANTKIKTDTLAETQRANLAREAENVRSNMRNESISSQKMQLEHQRGMQSIEAQKVAALYSLYGSLANAGARTITSIPQLKKSGNKVRLN